MDFRTIDYWDQELWGEISPLFNNAFGDKGAKPEKVIRNMFQKQLCFLHLLVDREEVVGMALTGSLKGFRGLIVDYLTVHHERRNQGLGLRLMEYIKHWSIFEGGYDSLLIEVESDPTSENLSRIYFWEKCGFSLTTYIHHYIWVPEPYQAMFLKLSTSSGMPKDGVELFKYIGQFHKASYKGV